MNSYGKLISISALFVAAPLQSEDVGARWGTETEERNYYRIVDIPIPDSLAIEAGAFAIAPDGRMTIGTRRGDILLMDDVDSEKPNPTFHQFASGLDEIFGMNWKDGSLYVTQSCELTRISDTDADGRADQFETISDAWGYENYHEYAFGSPFDPDGNMYIALGLSASYYSRALFRGWAFKITPDGESIPFASGMRSPGGIGFNEHGALMYIESQGPWNSSCSLKFVSEGAFLGHPASFNWYEYAPNLDGAPQEPESGSRVISEAERIDELEPYSVIFPYIRMGRSITGFQVNRTHGAFGPFDNQLFLGDYTQSLIMRATTERVNGVWQGACYPFREGLSTGILNIQFTPEGNLLCGGTNRGWPVRGVEPFALERLEWTGKTPFEIEKITVRPHGFRIEFTSPVDREIGKNGNNYALSTFTHIYHRGYGGPEVDQTRPSVKAIELTVDNLSVDLSLEEMTRGHVYEFDLSKIRSATGRPLVHNQAYYTLNEIPTARALKQPN